MKFGPVPRESQSLELTIEQALDLGIQFMHAGNYPSAITMFRGVLVHDPEHFEAIERLGSALFEASQYHEAFFLFWRGREIDRKHPMALTNYGLTLAQLGQAEKGLPDLERAAVIAERGVDRHVRALVWNNLGNTLERLGKYKDALHALDKGIANAPEDPFPWYNRGIVMLRLGRHGEAIDSLENAIARHAKNAQAKANEVADCHYNRGMARLALGDLKGGFADYEYRLTTSENENPSFGFPADKKWQGEELGETPLLIVAEQGLGDTIQFLRFIPEALRRAPNLMLAVQTALAPMVKACWPDLPLVPARAEIQHDKIGRWAGLMSLPYLFGTSSDKQLPPPWVPMLDHGRVALSDAGFKAGVCWAGNFRHKNDQNRSVPLDIFARVFDAPCRFYSLQQLRPGEERPFAELRATYENLWAAELTDLRDTAAIIAHCDLVISADTAVAHLAASIGVPTWILIPAQNTDWRWQLERTDSPWYPSATLWRQKRGEGWDDVIQAIRRSLTALAAGERAA